MNVTLPKRYKKTIRVKQGDPVPYSARYIKEEKQIIRYEKENGGIWDDDIPVYRRFDVYEVECDADGNIEGGV